MALTDQPYLPLYVDDWMNNNKLKMCSPAAHGVMMSVMCIMHKEDNYGSILLKQRFKQTDNQIKNFAFQLAKLCAFDLFEIEEPLNELLESKILEIENETLICKRMIKDAELSKKRANSGRSGGKKTQSKNKNISKNNQLKEQDFALAKDKANTVNGIVIENVNESVIDNEKGGAEEKTKIEPQKIVNLYHQFCSRLPKVQVLSKARKSSINARIVEHGLNKVTQVFQLAGQSNFLNGENKESWSATFDWLLKPTNFVKVLEGNYKNKVSKNNEKQSVTIN